MAESETRPWSDLIPDLVSLISNKLGLFELLTFRATCRSWRLASSSAKADLKKRMLHWPPWLLCQESIHREQCIVRTMNPSRKFRMNLPELVGTDFLGSFQGWLLLSNSESGKVFFFCPFARQKICLPDLLPSELCFHSMAELSSSPTSSDCTVCMISHQGEQVLVIYILRPGAESWDKVKVEYCFRNILGVVEDTGYHDGKFFFYNKGRTRAVKVTIESQTLEILNRPLTVILPSRPNQAAGNKCDDQAYIRTWGYLELEMVKECFAMEETAEAASVYLRGTQWIDHCGRKFHLLNESNVDHTILPHLSPKHMRRGIWIQPRLFAP